MDKKKMFLIMGGIILLTVFVAFYYVFNKSDEVLVKKYEIKYL